MIPEGNPTHKNAGLQKTLAETLQCCIASLGSKRKFHMAGENFNA
jgi:hypothetical protein